MDTADGNMYKMDDADMDEILRQFPKRTVEVYVPGKQVTLAHIIAHPEALIYEKLSLDADEGFTGEEAIGILKLTPWETTFPLSNIALQTADVRLGFADRFMGAVVITGNVRAVDEALRSVLDYCRDTLGFNVCKLTRS